MGTLFDLLKQFVADVRGTSTWLKVFLGPMLVPFVMFKMTNSLWGLVFSRIDGLIVPQGGSVDFSPLGLLNYVFPLDTMLTLMVTYGSIRLSCASIRIYKSFIPGISG